MITDHSNYENVRDYSLYINDTYTVQDIVNVDTPWTFDQTVKFTSDEGENSWFRSAVVFDGEHWYQTMSWNGENEVAVNYAVQQEDYDENIFNHMNVNMVAPGDITYWVNQSL